MHPCVLSTMVVVILVGCAPDPAMPEIKADFTLDIDPDGNGVGWVLIVSRSNLHVLARKALQHPELGNVDDIAHRDMDEIIAHGLQKHGFADCPTTPAAVQVSSDGGLTLMGSCRRAGAAALGT